MKNLIFILLVGSSVNCIAQNINYTVGVMPFNCYFNKGFFYTSGVNFNIDFQKNSIFLKTEGTTFKKLDARKRESSSNEQYIPFLNQSSLVYENNILTWQKAEIANKLKIRGGYHYFQHGSEPDWDYWFLDSINNQGVQVLSGFQTHSASLGLSWSRTKLYDSESEESKPKSKNTVEVDYLFGIAIKLKGFNYFNTYKEETQIANHFKFNRSGIKVSYQYERFINNHLSIFVGAEVLYAPFINYKPNNTIFVPRGSEKIFPFYPGLKLGLNIFRFPS